MKRWNYLWCLTLFTACVFGTDDVQDTGSLSGTIKTPTGEAAAFVEITAIPIHYNPMVDVPLAKTHRTQTDSKGRFKFDPLENGIYNFEGYQKLDGTRFLLQRIVVRSDSLYSHFELRLEPTGQINVLVKPFGMALGDYFYLPGTSHARRIRSNDSAFDVITLDSIPASTYASLLWGHIGKSATTDLIVSPLTLVSGKNQTLEIKNAWKNSVKISLSQVTRNRTQTLRNIPYLVKLSSTQADLNLAQLGGEDIRFTNAKGNALPFEMEQWDHTKNTAEIWVHIDSITPLDTTPSLTLYYGNPVVTSASSDTKTYSGVGMFSHIWHLANFQEIFVDAMGSNNLRVLNNPLAGNGVGPTTQHIRLDGLNQFGFAEKSSPALPHFTISLWFQTSTRQGGTLIAFGDSLVPAIHSIVDRQLWMDDSGLVHFGIVDGRRTDSTITHRLSSPRAFNDGQWHYVAAIMSPQGHALFLDGIEVASSSNLKSGDLKNSEGYWSVGYGNRATKPIPTPTSDFFLGSLDEVRIQSAAMNATWIQMCFETQKP